MLRNFQKFLFYLIVFLIPINTKKFLFFFKTPFNISINYNAVFIYLLDILIFIFLLTNISRIKSFFSFYKVFYLFLIVALISGFFAKSFPIFIYSFFHLFLFALFGGATAYLILNKEILLEEIFLLLGISSFVESIIGILQFRSQASVGLKFLGESILGPETSGIARVSTHFGNFLRVYGTMPHANILATFLVVGFLSFVYLFFKKQKVYYLIPLTFIFYSLFLTFSRSGMVIFLIGIIATMFLGAIKNLRKNVLVFLIVFFIVFFISYLILGDLLLARFYISTKEPSFTYRVNYNLIGWDLIKRYPLFGVGLGNQILTSLKENLYQNQKLFSVWQWQPVHNIYLLIASETGVFGFLLFCLFLFLIFQKSLILIKNNFFKNSLDFLDIYFPFLILILILAVGFVDHFPWDLESGQILFFLFLGMVKGKIS